MSRPKIEGNLRSRVLYARDAYHTLIATLHMWAVENLASLQLKSTMKANSQIDVGTSVPFGWAVGTDLLGRPELTNNDAQQAESEWFIPDFVGETLNIGSGKGAVDWTAKVDATDNPVLGTYQLITLDKAAAWFTNEFRRAMLQYNIKMTKRLTAGKMGRYRAMCHWLRGKARSGLYLQLGIERLKMVCLTQRRRAKGPQLIQTRRPVFAPYYTSFLFNGTHAIRLPQGRPALSKAEWLRRYMERRDKKRKTKVRHKDARDEVKVPTPKNGRPSRQIEAKIQTHRPVVQQYESHPAFESDSDFDWSELGRELLENVTDEVSKQAGEAIGEWVNEKFRDLTGLR